MSIAHRSSETQPASAEVRASNIQRDFKRAVGLYSVGDRSELVTRTIREGIRAFRAANWPIPTPIDPASTDWAGLTREAEAMEEAA